MNNLILNILYQFTEWGEKIRFTKEEISNLIEKYDIIKDNDNLLASILLWEEKFISNEELAKDFGLIYEKKDNEKSGYFYLIVDDFSDVLSNKYEIEIKYLNGDYDRDYYSLWDADIDYYWSDFTDETYKSMIEYLINNKVEIDTGDETFLVTQDIVNNENKIKIGEEWKSIEDLIDYDGMEDLKTEISISICDAQTNADYDEVEKRLISSFYSNIGPFERIMGKQNYYDKESKTTKERDIERLKIRLDKLDWSYVKSDLIDTYKNYGTIDFDKEIYGSFKEYVSDYSDFFEIDTPDYNYISGSIDKNYLNEIIQDRLY